MATEVERRTITGDDGAESRVRVTIDQVPADPESPYTGKDDPVLITRYDDDEFIWIEAEWHQAHLRVRLEDLRRALAEVDS